LLADYLSKVQEVDDFSLQPSVFASILRDFGPLEVNRFASAHNAQLPVFNSEYWCPKSAGVNAFTFSWTGSHNFCFPPPRLVFRMLQHARECQSRIVLVVLDWKSQPWWPLLVSHQGSEWAPSAGRFRRLSGGARTLRPGRTPEAAFFGRGYPDCDLFVLEFDFSGECLMALRPSVVDVFLHGDWSLEASGLSPNDLEIASLSAESRARAAQARAPATLSTYAGPWQKFKLWCQQKGVPYLRASPLTVALYLTKIMRSASSLPEPGFVLFWRNLPAPPPVAVIL
jgi:hypothetical protein